MRFLSQCFAQVGQTAPEIVGGLVGGIIRERPQRLRQPHTRDRAVAVQREQGQQPQLFTRPEFGQGDTAYLHLHAAEKFDYERT